MSKNMTDDELLAQVTGAADVVKWFGRWPSFHDAEVVSVELHRQSFSYVRVHAFNMTAALDDRGYYKLDKHAVVTFVLNDISSLELINFNHQNVLSDILVEQIEGRFRLALGDCYGVSGAIVAATLACELQPGLPPGKNYEAPTA